MFVEVLFRARRCHLRYRRGAYRGPFACNFSCSKPLLSRAPFVLQIVLFERPLRAPNRAFRAPPSCSKSCSISCFLSAPVVLQIVLHIVLFERTRRAPNRAPYRAFWAHSSCSESCSISCFLSAPVVLQIVLHFVLFERTRRAPYRASWTSASRNFSSGFSSRPVLHWKFVNSVVLQIVLQIVFFFPLFNSKKHQTNQKILTNRAFWAQP